MKNHPTGTVSASEIANWVYCHEAWRLDALGLQAVNETERVRGRSHHANKAFAERLAGVAIAIGRILIFVALLALAVFWAFSR